MKIDRKIRDQITNLIECTSDEYYSNWDDLREDVTYRVVFSNGQEVYFRNKEIIDAKYMTEPKDYECKDKHVIVTWDIPNKATPQEAGLHQPFNNLYSYLYGGSVIYQQKSNFNTPNSKEEYDELFSHHNYEQMISDVDLDWYRDFDNGYRSGNAINISQYGNTLYSVTYNSKICYAKTIEVVSKHIGDYAFVGITVSNCGGLKSIFFREGVEYIGYCILGGNDITLPYPTNLDIHIPKTVKYIHPGAFMRHNIYVDPDNPYYQQVGEAVIIRGTTKLFHVNPKWKYSSSSEFSNITEIGDYCYYKSTSSNNGYILDAIDCTKLTRIGKMAFYESTICSNKSCNFDNLVEMGMGAFAATQIVAAYLPKLTIIPDSCFERSNIETISIPVCEKIGNRAFYRCRQLTTSINDYSAPSGGIPQKSDGQEYKMFIFPYSMKYIGNNAFAVCLKLELVVWYSKNSMIEIGSGNFSNAYYFGKVGNADSSQTTSPLGDIMIVESNTGRSGNFGDVLLITNYACINKTPSILAARASRYPGTVTQIGFIYNVAGDISFGQVPNTVESIHLAKSAGKHSFFQSTPQLPITIDALTTEYIDPNAFDAMSIYNINVTNNANYYSDGRALYTADKKKLIKYFDGCYTTSTDPDSGETIKNFYETYSIIEECTEIGEYAFYNSTHIKTLTKVSTGSERPQLENVGDWAFANSSIETFTIFITNRIGKHAFQNSNITNISSPSGPFEDIKYQPKIIDDFAYCGCNGLTSNLYVVLNHVNYLGVGLFMNCKNMTSINFEINPIATHLKVNVDYIPELTFSGCVALQTIKISCSLKYIGNFAFAGCTSLLQTAFDQLVNYQKKLEYIGIGCFGANFNGTDLPEISITLPESLYFLGPMAFQGWLVNDPKIYTNKITCWIQPFCARNTSKTDRKIKIPEGVRFIDCGNGIYFSNNGSITGYNEVEFPNTLEIVTKLMDYDWGCQNLKNKKIYFPNSIRKISLDSFKFQGTPIDIYLPVPTNSIYDYPFAGPYDPETTIAKHNIHWLEDIEAEQQGQS